MIKLDWQPPNEFGELVAIVPAVDYHRTLGHYRIGAQRRPGYCDRGQWLVLVDAEGVDGLDHQEGFPRYYFETATMMSEMEAWVNKRKACLNADAPLGRFGDDPNDPTTVALERERFERDAAKIGQKKP